MTVNAVTKLDEAPSQELAEVRDMSAGLLEVIARAARDPSVDIDKMERLLEMQERVQARQARAAYATALSEMQDQLPIINRRGAIKNNSGNVQSTYALWEDINEQIKPILKHYGFALSFKTRREDATVIVTGILSHCDGHSEESELSLPADTSGSKNAVQAIGSSTQYGKRYTASALLNLTSRGEDDDGNAGGVGPTISEAQLKELSDLKDDVGADLQRFCRYMKVDSLAAIRARDFDRARAALEAKRKGK